MEFDLRIGTHGRRIVFWPTEADEKRFLGGFCGEAKVELRYEGHKSHGRVNQLIISFEDPQEPEQE